MKIGDPLEVAPVPCHQDEIVREGGGGDQEIEVGDEPALPTQERAVMGKKSL